MSKELEKSVSLMKPHVEESVKQEEKIVNATTQTNQTSVAKDKNE